MKLELSKGRQGNETYRVMVALGEDVKQSQRGVVRGPSWNGKKALSLTERRGTSVLISR